MFKPGDKVIAMRGAIAVEDGSVLAVGLSSTNKIYYKVDSASANGQFWVPADGVFKRLSDSDIEALGGEAGFKPFLV